MKLPISVIILTYNEELNIENCLKSIADWANEIFIVDSYSTDSTAQIAKRYGAKIFEHPFQNQAKQFNWALDNLPIKTEWILRLDADEYLTEELKQEIAAALRNTKKYENTKVNGFYIKRKVYFMGRWIKHGGYYPTWLLRLFRKGKARSEDREMDEHIILKEGQPGYLKNDFIDDNKKGLSFWIEKHNQFASREAAEVMKSSKLKVQSSKLFREGPVAKRRLAKGRYYRLPIFLRAFLYFIWRYLFRLGFLDGKEGLIFHLLQGFWYRFLIDAKLYEHTHRKFEARNKFEYKNQNVPKNSKSLIL